MLIEQADKRKKKVPLLKKAAQGKASFCEQKEAKKLYLLWAVGAVGDIASGQA
ncbi:MAG TPA: hypothetical protein VL356_12515 [Acidocella sp.]|nr:hypothetical protein [Acidocella sp.]